MALMNSNELLELFKIECSSEQVAAIIEFLNWSLTIEPLIHEHTERAMVKAN